MSDDAIPAATVILVREREGGAPELLMVVRAVDMAFAGGAWVFPGGRIDEADRRIDASGWRRARRRRSRSAGRDRDPDRIVAAADRPTSARLQAQLLDGRELDQLLAPHGIDLDLETLVPLARWVPKFHANATLRYLVLRRPSTRRANGFRTRSKANARARTG